MYKDDIKVIKVDIDKHKEFAEQYDIMSIPTMLFFSKGNLVRKETGFKPDREICSMIEESLIPIKVDILDLSTKGEKNWMDAKEHYMKKMEEIENKISNYLKEQLAKAQNSSEQFKIFKRFQQLSQKQRIHLGLQEYQAVLVEEIKAHLSILLDTLLALSDFNNSK